MKIKLSFLFAVLFTATLSNAAPALSNKIICYDLVGHTLSEGTENGYYPQSWRWKIEEGEITDFRILDVLEDTPTHYTFDAKIRLSSKTRSYDAKVTVYYILNAQRRWEIEMVKSRQMSIVKTHRYDDCIKSYINRELAGPYLYLENNCEITLEVGGQYFTGDQWVRFAKTVDPHSTLGMGFFSDFSIEYIERP